MTTFWHYTCTHSRDRIGDSGKLLPAAQLVEPDRLAKFPAWQQTLYGIIWLADLDTPERNALGLTSMTLGCDRTAHRYRVVGFRPIRYVDHRRQLPKRLRDGLESALGALPMHWWMAYTPVPVVYDPVVPAGSR